jgi:two-component system phosphoglycerate transport system response regulator PgtA
MMQSNETALKILLIEDDADLCSSWEELFELIGHRLRCHRRALDALADQEGIEASDLLISDFYLPDINGVELIHKIREKKPSLKAVLLTGSRDAAVLNAAKKLSNCSVVHKPINIETIEEVLKKLIAA